MSNAGNCGIICGDCGLDISTACGEIDLEYSDLVRGGVTAEWTCKHCGSSGATEIELGTRLTTAAPDLLSALEKILDDCDHGWDFRTLVRATAKDAIAKATGK